MLIDILAMLKVSDHTQTDMLLTPRDIRLMPQDTLVMQKEVIQQLQVLILTPKDMTPMPLKEMHMQKEDKLQQVDIIVMLVDIKV